jgi:hypothetical protein
MIKRSTAVVVALFVIALIALLLVQRNPGILQSATPTPIATELSKLLPDWKDMDITEAILNRAIGGETALTRNSDGSWNNTTAGIVPPGKVEQMLSELLATNILVVLPADTPLEDLNLVNPGQIIMISAADNRKTIIRVGGLTPTQSGYYVKVDDLAPVVVSKYAVEAVLQLFDEALPALEGSPTP